MTDPSGETDQCSAVITVVDDTPPIVDCQDITVQLDANGAAQIGTNDIVIGAFDNCGDPDITLSNTTFDCDDAGEINAVQPVW